MPAYDNRWFEPPAPLARVTLRHMETGASLSDVPMLLDTGADITLLPQAAVISLGVAVVPEARYELLTFDNRTNTALIVRMEMIFLGRTFRGQFPLLEQEWGIIGRNVLNAVSLLFDGPHSTWEQARSL